ncbi:MAG: hypothetical protein L3J34_12370 [Flavobacteriaceae bacterium]|nr:hypothetical protein [Flavobacteriaceae bacterium]
MNQIINLIMKILKNSRNYFRNFKSLLLSIAMTFVIVLNSNAQTSDQPLISFDFAKENGKIKNLNGINVGTVMPASANTDFMTQSYKDLKVPYTRLHDCHYPYPDVVDIPAIFPLFHLDADDPKNYNFKKTDDYILELLKSGTEIIYRLGVSIEHTKVKHYIHPPADYEKWAKICVNIIRHYNEGWANGFHLGIKYWEVWNEADHPKMWSGTQEQYFELYKTTVTAIKKYDPKILVGTAGLAGVNEMGPPLLDYCQKNKLPIDFFSWHDYTQHPEQIVKKALYVRELLDDYGFEETESHINEWNYWPGTWSKLSNKYYRKNLATNEMGSAKSATFIATTLINLQDLPVEQSMFYSGAWRFFGIFDSYGVPRKSFYTFKATALLLDAPNRVFSKKDSTYNNIAVIGGLSESKDQAIIMLSNYNSKEEFINIKINNLPWSNATKVEVFTIDDENNLGLSPKVQRFNSSSFVIREKLPAPVVALIKLSPLAE